MCEFTLHKSVFILRVYLYGMNYLGSVAWGAECFRHEIAQTDQIVGSRCAVEYELRFLLCLFPVFVVSVQTAHPCVDIGE